MEYFDYETMARDAGLNPEQLGLLANTVRGEFPSDLMLFELHMLRACRAIRDGSVKLEQILARPTGGDSSRRTPTER
jgi:hypothetical protein